MSGSISGVGQDLYGAPSPEQTSAASPEQTSAISLDLTLGLSPDLTSAASAQQATVAWPETTSTGWTEQTLAPSARRTSRLSLEQISAALADGASAASADLTSMEVDLNPNPLQIKHRMKRMIDRVFEKMFELEDSEEGMESLEDRVNNPMNSFDFAEARSRLEVVSDSLQDPELKAQKEKVKSILLKIQRDFASLRETLTDLATTEKIKRQKESESFLKSRVEKGFIKLQTVLPVAEFSLLEASLNPQLLGTIFETIADSFSFDEDVKKIIEQYRNPGFTELLVLKDETLQMGFEACYALLECILPKLQTIYDESLCCLWRFIITHKKFNLELRDLDAEKIREFLKTDEGKQLTDFVKQLDLRGAHMKILSPEINQFSKLEKIFLQNSGISCFPVILREHPNFCPLEKRDIEKKNWLQIDMG